MRPFDKKYDQVVYCEDLESQLSALQAELAARDKVIEAVKRYKENVSERNIHNDKYGLWEALANLQKEQSR